MVECRLNSSGIEKDEWRTVCKYGKKKKHSLFIKFGRTFDSKCNCLLETEFSPVPVVARLNE